MPRVAAICAFMLFVPPCVTGQPSTPSSLRAMADTELEFAATARAKGIRDSFLEFFTDDSVAFDPKPIKAKDRLLKRPSQSFSAQELTWEPRMGDVAASGELGWLTGPSTYINHVGDKQPHYGNYLSVWRKQPDGRWRVYIDVGTDVPTPAPFPPGFTRFASGETYMEREGKQRATASLIAADRELNDRIGTKGTSAAFADRLHTAARLHRNGMLPLVGRDAIVGWFKDNVPAMKAVSGAAETAASGDFGYSYGTFEVTTPKPQTSAYVRLWTRDTSGRWLIVADAVGS